MWLLLGGGAVLFAVINLVFSLQSKSSRWYGFISLSLTALTVCAFYSDGAMRVIHEDRGELMDIKPPICPTLLFRHHLRPCLKAKLQPVFHNSDFLNKLATIVPVYTVKLKIPKLKFYLTLGIIKDNLYCTGSKGETDEHS